MSWVNLDLQILFLWVQIPSFPNLDYNLQLTDQASVVQKVDNTIHHINILSSG